VEEMVQKRKTAAMATASAVQLNDGDMVERETVDIARRRKINGAIISGKWSVDAQAMAVLIMTSASKRLGNLTFLN
jgi:hypothetical protein